MRSVISLGVLLALHSFAGAQPTVEQRSEREREDAQRAALEERLMAIRIDSPPARNPIAVRAFERLFASRIDRIALRDYPAPEGRGHRFGADLEADPLIISVAPDGTMDSYGEPVTGLAVLARYVAGQERMHQILRHPGHLTVVLVADPGASPQLVRRVARVAGAVAGEVRLAVIADEPDVLDEATRPDIRRALEPCLALAYPDSVRCVARVVRASVAGCPEVLDSFPVLTGELYPRVRFLENAFELCGPDPFVDYELFVAAWAAYARAYTPRHAEYLLLDRAPPTRARTVQAWVPQLMREQGIAP